MIGVTIDAVDDSATHLDMNAMNSGVLVRATNTLSLFRTQRNGKPIVTTITGQQAVDLYNALARIKAGTWTAV
jgi:hypothetical protein